MFFISFIFNILLIILLFMDSTIWSYIKHVYNCHKMNNLNMLEWKTKVENICIKWNRKTPTICLNDGVNNIFDTIFRFNQSSTLQSWQKAGLLLGLDRKVDIYKFLDKDGNWKGDSLEIDLCLLAFAILKQTNDVCFIKPAMDTVYELCLNRVGSDGIIAYRSNMPDLHFVDTIGFTVPFLFLYGKIYKNEEAISLGKKQLNSFFKCGLSPLGLPYHAFHRKKGYNLGVCGWARGVGWYAFGLIAAVKYLDKNDKDYMSFELELKSLANVLINYQNEDGGFCWNILSLGRSETSGTAMLGLLFYEAYLKFGENKFLMAAQSCLHAIIVCTKNNGEIYYAQGDSKGLGLYSSLFETMPFAQGIALLLCKRLENNMQEVILDD